MITAHPDTALRPHRRRTATVLADPGGRVQADQAPAATTDLVGRTAVLVYACDDHGRAAVSGDVYDVRFPFRSMHAGQAVSVVAQHGDVLLLSANTAGRFAHGDFA